MKRYHILEIMVGGSPLLEIMMGNGQQSNLPCDKIVVKLAGVEEIRSEEGMVYRVGESPKWADH